MNRYKVILDISYVIGPLDMLGKNVLHKNVFKSYLINCLINTSIEDFNGFFFFFSPLNYHCGYREDETSFEVGGYFSMRHDDLDLSIRSILTDFVKDRLKSWKNV